MAEPFKERVNAEAVERIATRVAAAWPAFPAGAFVAAVVPKLADLELKDRVALVADALADRLPTPFPEALRVLVAALPDAPNGAVDVGGGMWVWPVLTVVERRGAGEPEASLSALREMTSRFSAEFAVRPILVAHPELAYATLAEWVGDPNVHVRRLVSEGSRPRLPWGQRLPAAVSDPTRGLALIERLVDDPEPYVRRSVANHLGDVYEPFSGSGTTIIACEMTGRSCHAIELSPAYVDVAVQRWQAFTGKRAVRDADGVAFDDAA